MNEKIQLSLNFDAGLVSSYATCREYVAARVHQQGRPQKAIAADMDLSPSHLSRKLSQSPDDSSRLTLDDFEHYIETQGDVQPVLYLVEKYLTKESADEIEKQIEALRLKAQQIRQSA